MIARRIFRLIEVIEVNASSKVAETIGFNLQGLSNQAQLLRRESSFTQFVETDFEAADPGDASQPTRRGGTKRGRPSIRVGLPGSMTLRGRSSQLNPDVGQPVGW